MQHRVIECLVGLLFGVGLIVAGVTDPSQVLGFLALAGIWDPSLAFVMGSSLMFGAGWGLASFCPGPAIVSLGAGQPKAAAFVVAMLMGTAVFELAQRPKTP